MTPRHRSHRGSVYVLVIITMAVVGAVVLSSLQIATGRNREAGLVTDSFQANHYAHSAIEAGLAAITTDPTWRWTNGDGAWRTGIVTDRGTLSLSVTGGDGANLGVDAWQPAKLTGTGQADLSRTILEVQVGLQGVGVPDVGELVFSNTGLALWPFEGDANEVEAEQVQGNRPKFVNGTEPFRPGAVPGLGVASAPWFTGGAHAMMDIGFGYESIRSVSFWLWADSVTATQGVLGRNAISLSGGSWAVYIEAGRIFGYVESSGGTSSTGAAISARQWHHVVLTLEDSRGVLYIDGAEVGRTTSRPANYWDASLNTEILYVGVSHSFSVVGSSSVSHPFTGSICNLVLMGQPLRAAEVKQLYDGYPAPAQYKVLADTWNRVSN